MKRWVIHASTELEARHALVSYHGKPEESHSHRWRIAIRVGTDHLNHEGFAIDFEAVKVMLEAMVAPLRECDLNTHPEIGHPTPSAERLAEVVALTLEPEVHRLGAALLSVTVWEGPENRVDLNLTAAPAPP